MGADTKRLDHLLTDLRSNAERKPSPRFRIICGWCPTDHQMERIPPGCWMVRTDPILESDHLSHGCCPDCAKSVFGKYKGRTA